MVEIPVDQIRVTTRLRATDDSKIQDLAESIAGVGLLHPITVSQNGDQYHLLAGNHRLEAHRLLGRKTIPATVNDADPLVEELIEIEENLISNRLSPIQEANHIVRWEEILSQLGRRAVTGDNRWNRTGLTNADLAKSRGMAKSTCLMTKTIAKINPDWLYMGMPLKIWLPSKFDIPFLGDLLQAEWVHYAFSWSGAIYDLSIPFLLL